jgi:Zn-dependent peptidase ImmA (M78 family)
MLKTILDSTGLNTKVCADLLGLDHKLFRCWVEGQRPIPGYIISELCSVLGVSSAAITSTTPGGSSAVEDAPAIWFRFRSGEKLTDADRELVVVIRKLGHHMDELEELTGSRGVLWSLVFEGIRKEVNKHASFVDQGKAAGKYFRQARQLGFPMVTRDGVKGNGDVLRDNLRNMGLRVVESPMPLSSLEGCSFYVGSPGAEKPCLFANTYKQTWFRRNMVLLHELAHAIFDIETTAASLDFLGHPDQRQIEELRADAFAQEVLAPQELLHHIAETNGLRWDRLDSKSLALLVAHTQVEQRMVVKAALDAKFITEELAGHYRSFEIHDDLRALSERALSTEEYIETKRLSQFAVISPEVRTTTVPARALRLPLPYVIKVVELAKSNDISYGKAAQMLMIDKETLLQRFGPMLEEGMA